MSEIDKALYADAEEIATAINLAVRTVHDRAKNEKWQAVSDAKSRGKNKKKWFEITKLPKDIKNAVWHQRNCKRFLINEPSRQNDHSTVSGTAARDEARIPLLHEQHDAASTQIDALHTVEQRSNVSVQSSDAGRGADYHSARVETVELGAGARASGASEIGGTVGVDINRKGGAGDQSMDGGITLGHSGSSSSNVPVRIDPLKTDDKQRKTDGARQYILNFVEQFDGSDTKAVIFINQGYVEGSLHFDLQDAYLHCNDKKGKKIKPLNLRSVQRWKELREETGSCIPKKTRIKIDWQTVWWLPLFLSCYRKPQKPTLTEAHFAFKQLWEAQGFQEECPSYYKLFRLKEKIPPKVLEWGRSTGSEYRAYLAFTRRDWSDMSSNEVWVGDGHSFKAKVRHPDKPNTAFAPEVTVIIDARSRYIVGWAFSLSENQIAVSEALGKGMIAYGKPLVYYSDNGSGQTAKTIDHPAGGMLARMGVRHETGIPGNPQGRGIIEGLWDITTIAVAKTFKTFQGTGMDDGAIRKNTAAINSAKSQSLIPDFVPTWEAFIEACEARFEWYNTQHKHSALGGRTPAEVYYANFDDSWACRLTEEEKITLYRPFVERMPNRGEVRFINNIYFNKKLEELPAKATVRVSYDLHDANVVWISDLQGVFICEAVWDGNKVDGFAKSFREELKQQRIKGQKKRAMDKYNEADMEGDNVIDGEVLKRIEYEAPEIIEPLKIVQPDFAQQQPEEQRLSYLETMRQLQDGDWKAAGNE